MTVQVSHRFLYHTSTTPAAKDNAASDPFGDQLATVPVADASPKRYQSQKENWDLLVTDAQCHLRKMSLKITVLHFLPLAHQTLLT